MKNLGLAAQRIKETISAQDVGEALGLEIRHGRCQCPIHGGNDFNCVLYKGDRGYYCHVCKSGGDIIKFVQEYHKTTFKDAVAWFDSTFRLGLELEKAISPEEARKAEIALQRRKEARELAVWKDRAQFDVYLAADRILAALEEQRDLYAPKTADEDWHPLFCNAVRMIPAARRFTEKCLMKCMKEKL